MHLQSLYGGLDTGAASFCAQNLHDGVEVGGVGLAREGDAQEGADIGHGAGPGGGVLLVELHVGGEAQGLGQGLDLVEPNRGVVRRVVGFEEALEGGLHGLRGEGFGEGGVPVEEPVVEEAHVGLGLLPGGKILPGLFASPANGEDGHGVGRVSFQGLGKVRVKLPGILRNQVIDLLGRHGGDHVLGHVAELGVVEQGTGGVQLLGGELEFPGVCGGIGPPPVLVVGVQKGHDVLVDGLHREALGFIIGESQLRVLPLAELPLGGSIHLHERADVDVLG